MAVKKLIEVALPLEKINEASAREKSIRHGHPSTLHLWWARRPLATARAVIWASLVDDPSSHPELYPTEEDQSNERQRLFKILEDLVVWENSNNEAVLNLANAEIMKYTGSNPPAFLDPFAGGGAIPLEAQRLGLEAHAHDLNPVAVMINKAMIEIPPHFSGRAAVNPDSQRLGATGSVGARGLAEDVQYYGEWMKQEAIKRIGHLYPKVKVPSSQGGGEATAIAWIWTRTVKCPNPACGCEAPLVRSFDLSTKKGNEAYFDIVVDNGKWSCTVKKGKSPQKDGTVNRKGATCICCGTPIGFPYIREEGKAGRLNGRLLATIAEGRHGRAYFSADDEQIRAADVKKPEEYPDAPLPNNPRNFNTPIYGLTHFADHFTNRQLTMLVTLCDLVGVVKDKVTADAEAAGMANDHISLCDGGSGARAYGEAVGVYLSFLIDKMADYHSSVCSWHSSGEKMRNTFGRQALPMVWDYAECNPFCSSSGSFNNMLEWIYKCVVQFPATRAGYAKQFNAMEDTGLRNIAISTDPPYYDNIVYADLADFFYIWLRKSLLGVFPDVFSTMLVPKADELVATQYRFGGSVEKAQDFFEDGMLKTCKVLYLSASDDIPVTIYYAYKQSESIEDDEQVHTSSTGWETMLTAIIKSGFTITGTWPMRTEMAVRQIASGANALASSIVLVCRKRSETASICTRRNFINELKRELRPALQKLQVSNIAPVDLAQSAIGPGMGVYSKYAQVLEADGTPMTVRSALQVINHELDLFFNEQDGELDSESRFCVDLYSQFAFNEMPFGDANTLATAKNTSVAIMASHGILYAQKGKVHLIERPELPTNIDTHEGSIWLLCQQLTYRMEKEGVEGCASVVVNMFGSNAERAKDLAYRLYTIAERKRWAQEAYAYNALVVAWPEIQSRAAELKAIQPEQMTIFDYQ